MKSSSRRKKLLRLVIPAAAVLGLAVYSSARTVGTSVNIVNNSNKEIRNVYLSHVNVDDWGANQLGDVPILPGQSFALTSVACDQQVKVVAEDADGCFLSTVVNCGESATWTVTDTAQRNCGN